MSTQLDNTVATTRLDASAASYVPATGKFYHGAIGADFDVSGRREKDYHPIASLNKQAMRDGDFENILTPIDYESYRRWERVNRQGSLDEILNNKQAAVDFTSLANITRVELMTAILNELYKETHLNKGANFIPVPKLKLDYDVMLHIKTRGKGALVKKRQKSTAEAPEFVQTNFDLANYGKLQRLVDIPDEDEMTALLSPTKHMISDITQVMAQDINQLILEDGIQKFKSVTKGSWKTLAGSGNQSSRNPLEDIAEERKRITKNHGRVDTAALNSVTWAHFTSNTFVRGYEHMLKQLQPGVMSFEKLPGISFIIDEDVPDSVMALYSRKALTVGDGPMVSEAFRDAQEGVSGHVIRKWIQPLVNSKLKDAFGSYMENLW